MSAFRSAPVVVAVLILLLGSAGRLAQTRQRSMRWSVPSRTACWSQRGRASASWVRVLDRWSASRADVSENVSGEVLRLRSALASGGSMTLAIRDLASGGGPWSESAQRASRRIDAGRGARDVLDAWATESEDPAVTLLADAVAIATTTGGSQIRALDAVLSALRDRSALEREIRALSSQARASALVLIATPAVFAVAVAIADARVRTLYLHSPLGAMCVGSGLALDAAGAWWMGKLVRRVS